MKKRVSRFLVIAIFILSTLLATGCTKPVTSVPLTEIILGGNEFQIVENQTVDFTVTHNPVNTTDTLGDPTYTITGNAPVSDGDYTVDGNKITFKKSNLYTVSCVVNGIKSNDFDVRVTPYYEVDWINMADSSTTIAYIGEKCAITAFLYGVAFDPSDPLFLPDNPGLRPFATNQNFTLSLAPSSTADGTFTVINDKHFFVPTVSGKANIVLASESNPSVTAMVYIDVVDTQDDILPTSIDLVTLNDSISVGESTILTASVLPRNATIDLTCVRDSSSTAAFTVAPNNEGGEEGRNVYAYKITATKAGKAVIKVYSNDDTTVLKKITIQILPTQNAESDFTFTKILDNEGAEKGVKITAVKIAVTDSLNIPVYVAGLPVLEIGDGLLKDNTQVKSVVLPFFCTALGNNAFAGCTNLSTIVMPYHLNAIGNDCFKNNTALTEMKLPALVTQIGDGAFDGCSKLTSFVMGNSVTKIGANALRGTKLGEMTLPNSLTQVGANAFDGITTISRLYIPQTVSTMGANVLAGWTATQVVDAEAAEQPDGWAADWAGNAALTPAFAVDNFTWNDNGSTVVITGYRGAKADLTVPATFAGKPVIGIDGSAFRKNKAIRNVTFAADCALTYIGEYAFADSSLQELTNIPVSVTTIGGSNIEDNKNNGNTFLQSNLSKITFVTGGEKDLKFFVGVFASCTSLVNIVLPERLENISDFAFSNDSKLETVTFEENRSRLKILGSYTFGECKALKAFTILPGITQLGDSTFFNCSGLTELTVPATVLKTAQNVFSGMKGTIKLPFAEGKAPKGWNAGWAGGSTLATLVYAND